MSDITDMQRLLVRAKTRITALEAQVEDARHETRMAESRATANRVEAEEVRRNRDALIARIEAERKYVEQAGRERDAARHMLTVYGCRDAAGHNEDDCPLCSAEHALLNALAERDALREQVTCGEHERMALVVVADAIRDDRTEARRVLRAVCADLDLLVPVAQTSELPVTANAMIRISADIAAVLAQEEK